MSWQEDAEREMWDAAVPSRDEGLTGQERNELFVRFGITSSDLLDMVMARFANPNYDIFRTEAQIERFLYRVLTENARSIS